MNVRCPQCEAVYRVDPAKVPERGVRARCAACGYVISVALERGMVGAPQGTGPGLEVAPTPTAPERPIQTPPDIASQPPPESVDQHGQQFAQRSIEETAAAQAPGPVLVQPEPKPAPRRHEPEEPARIRYSRPFVQPRIEPEPSTAETRPSAPVFRPTPGTPPVKTPAVPELPAPPAPLASTAEPAAGAPTGGPQRHVNPFLSKDPTQKARRLARALVSDMIVYQPKKRQEALEKGTLKEDFKEEIKKSWEEYTQQVGEDLANSTDFFTDALNDILAGGRQIF